MCVQCGGMGVNREESGFRKVCEEDLPIFMRDLLYAARVTRHKVQQHSLALDPMWDAIGLRQVGQGVLGGRPLCYHQMLRKSVKAYVFVILNGGRSRSEESLFTIL